MPPKTAATFPLVLELLIVEFEALNPTRPPTAPSVTPTLLDDDDEVIVPGLPGPPLVPTNPPEKYLLRRRYCRSHSNR